MNGILKALSFLPLLGLSGCLMTTGAMNSLDDKYKEKTIFTDQIIAVGMNKLPLKDYPNAVIAVGQKFSYITQSVDTDGQGKPIAVNDKLIKLVQGLNMGQLYIRPTPAQLIYLLESDEFQTQKKYNSTTCDIRVADDVSIKNVSQFSTMVAFAYSKETAKITAAENKLMRELDMNCEQNAYGISECTGRMSLNLTIAPEIKNIQSLNYQLKAPITMNIVSDHYSASKVVGQYLLVPVAVVLDIVTLPVQMAVCSVAWCNSKGFI